MFPYALQHPFVTVVIIATYYECVNEFTNMFIHKNYCIAHVGKTKRVKVIKYY